MWYNQRLEKCFSILACPPTELGTLRPSCDSVQASLLGHEKSYGGEPMHQESPQLISTQIFAANLSTIRHAREDILVHAANQPADSQCIREPVMTRWASPGQKNRTIHRVMNSIKWLLFSATKSWGNFFFFLHNKNYQYTLLRHFLSIPKPHKK